VRGRGALLGASIIMAAVFAQCPDHRNAYASSRCGVFKIFVSGPIDHEAPPSLRLMSAPHALFKLTLRVSHTGKVLVRRVTRTDSRGRYEAILSTVLDPIKPTRGTLVVDQIGCHLRPVALPIQIDS